MEDLFNGCKLEDKVNMRTFGDNSIISKSGQRHLKKAIAVSVIKKLIFIVPLFIIALISGACNPVMHMGRVWLLFGIGGAVAVVIILIIKLEYRYTNLPAYAENERIRLSLADKIKSIPLNGLNEFGLSGLSGILVNDGAIMEGMLSRMIPELWSTVIALPICFTAFALVDIRLALAAFLTIPAAIAVLLITMGIQKRLTDKQIPAKQAAASALMEYIGGMKEIKSYMLMGEKNEDLKDKLRELKERSFKMETVSGVLVAWSDVIMEIGVGLVVFLAARFLSEQTIGLPVAVLFFAAVLSVYAPVGRLLTTLPTIMYMNKGMGRMNELLSMKDCGGNKRPDFKSYSYSFDNVTLSLNGKTILNSISADISEGEVTAIVGPSGSGKTTFANLLCGFYEADSGQVKFGGYDIKKCNQNHYFKFISAVFQDVVLFNDTILENIRVGDPKATDREVLEAGRLACCDPFVLKKENGYNHRLNENGKDLSGGERQRISIARAILKNAPVIILDEATSALDAGNETLVQQGISRLAKEKTVIIIAHRLRNVINADKIIVMNEGRIEAVGKHDELLKISSVYRRLFELQEQGLSWKL